MVRALVGTMVEIARGYRKGEALAAIIGAHDRTKAGAAAPPNGLVLEEVYY
jgi:tRNA pseudouridine38-40 synthase